jgi:hypothetical protein
VPRTKIGDPPVVDLEPLLWTCPKCGRRFVSRNLWHACGDYSVEGFLQGKERARESCSNASKSSLRSAARTRWLRRRPV